MHLRKRKTRARRVRAVEGIAACWGKLKRQQDQALEDIVQLGMMLFGLRNIVEFEKRGVRHR